jgi:hypothetical protein
MSVNKSSEENTKYAQRKIICNVCGTTYQRHRQLQHFNSERHKNHKNNVKTNHTEFLLETKKTLDKLNTLINNALKNNTEIEINNNDDYEENNKLPLKYVNNNDYELKLNNIKEWQKNIFEK